MEKKGTHASVKFLLIENYCWEFGRACVRFQMEENFETFTRVPLGSLKRCVKNNSEKKIRGKGERNN